MRLMNWVDRFDGLYFHDNSILDHQVDAISEFKFVPLIDDRQRHFGQNPKAAVSKLMCEAGLIGTFEKAWAKDGVNLHGGVHYRTGISFTWRAGARAGAAMHHA